MTTLLLALTLALGLTPAEQALDPEPTATTPSGSDAAAQSPASEPGPGTPSPDVEAAAVPSGPDAAAKSPRPSASKIALRIVGLEAGAALLSGLTTVSPQTWGWVYVGTSPVIFAMYADKHGVADGVATGVVVAGIGAYNVIELKKDKYTQSDRFWRNFAAWNVGVGVMILTDLVASPSKSLVSTITSVSLGPTPGGAGLLVAGRF